MPNVRHVTVFEPPCGNVCHGLSEREGESLFSRSHSHNVLGRNVLGCTCVLCIHSRWVSYTPMYHIHQFTVCQGARVRERLIFEFYGDVCHRI